MKEGACIATMSAITKRRRRTRGDVLGFFLVPGLGRFVRSFTL